MKITRKQLQKIITESIADYFKQDGGYYGADPNIGQQNGWFVYLFKDEFTGEIKAAEIAKANMKNAGMHLNSGNGAPKKYFRKYEDAVQWCRSKGIAKISARNGEGRLRVDAPQQNNEPRHDISDEDIFNVAYKAINYVAEYYVRDNMEDVLKTRQPHIRKSSVFSMMASIDANNAKYFYENRVHVKDIIVEAYKKFIQDGEWEKWVRDAEKRYEDEHGYRYGEEEDDIL